MKDGKHGGGVRGRNYCCNQYAGEQRKRRSQNVSLASDEVHEQAGNGYHDDNPDSRQESALPYHRPRFFQIGMKTAGYEYDGNRDV